MPASSSTAVHAAAADQAAPGRASADLVDAMDLAGVSVEGTRSEKRQKLSATVGAPSTVRGRGRRERVTAHTTRDSIRSRSSVKGAGGVTRGDKNLGAAAATALLTATGGAATSARGLQLSMIKEAFSRLDVDGDGFISAGDLGQAFQRMGRDASDRR